MNERIIKLRTVGNRLVWLLAGLVAIGIPAAFLADWRTGYGFTPLAVFWVGLVGGFVGLQRRLKVLPAEDLTLLANSWVSIALSPISGAILAELVYLLFISGLLKGSMFPTFVADKQAGSEEGIRTLFDVHCADAANYAMVLFWSFVAGFSEKFATSIIGQFGAHGSQQDEPEDEA